MAPTKVVPAVAATGRPTAGKCAGIFGCEITFAGVAIVEVAEKHVGVADEEIAAALGCMTTSGAPASADFGTDGSVVVVKTEALPTLFSGRTGIGIAITGFVTDFVGTVFRSENDELFASTDAVVGASAVIGVVAALTTGNFDATTTFEDAGFITGGLRIADVRGTVDAVFALVTAGAGITDDVPDVGIILEMTDIAPV